ncbi:MAG: sugar transferase, partial [Clostridia bacterium]|nr:sugar transferase [Clostridia bacterium]
KTGKERIFNLYKFRTMTDEVDKNGRLLLDSERLGRFGKMLRATSLDEIPEAFNILKGDMSIIGPRPQLVRDMVFMTDEQRMRHTAKPGLSGLAQVNGRNAVTWNEKLKWDLKYIEKVTFWGDLRLVLKTAKQVFIRENITATTEETDIALDFGDALLQKGKITKEEYDRKQQEANEILSLR